MAIMKTNEIIIVGLSGPLSAQVGCRKRVEPSDSEMNESTKITSQFIVFALHSFFIFQFSFHFAVDAPNAICWYARSHSFTRSLAYPAYSNRKLWFAVNVNIQSQERFAG